jgi:hypothetical protein
LTLQIGSAHVKTTRHMDAFHAPHILTWLDLDIHQPPPVLEP